MVVSSHGNAFSSRCDNIDTCNKQTNIISFRKCAFVNNSNMKPVLHILLRSLKSANVLIDIRDSTFVGNHEKHIIKVSSKVKILWQLTHYLTVMDTKILSNRHTGLGHSLIWSANGLVKFLHSVIIKNNTYDRAIILLSTQISRWLWNFW